MRLSPLNNMRLTTALTLTALLVSLTSARRPDLKNRLANKLGRKKPVPYRLHLGKAALRAQPAAKKSIGLPQAVALRKVYACGKTFQATPCSGASGSGRQHCIPCFPGYRNIQFHICQPATKQAPSCTDALWWLFRQKDNGGKASKTAKTAKITKTAPAKRGRINHLPKTVSSTKKHGSLLSRLSKGGYQGFRKSKMSKTQSKHSPYKLQRQNYPAAAAAAHKPAHQLTRAEQIAALTKKLQLVNDQLKTRYSSRKAASKAKPKKYVFGHVAKANQKDKPAASKSKIYSSRLSHAKANHKAKPAASKYKIYSSRLSHAKSKPKPVINRYKSAQIKKPAVKSRQLQNRYRLPQVRKPAAPKSNSLQNRYRLAQQNKYRLPQNRYQLSQYKPKITLGKKLSKPKNPYLFDGQNFYKAYKGRFPVLNRGNNRYQGNYYGRQQQKPRKTPQQIKHEEYLRQKYGLGNSPQLRRGFHKNAGLPKLPNRYRGYGRV